MAERGPCPVPACDRDKPAHYILCPRCWRLGPKELKRRLRSTVTEARETGAPAEQRILAIKAFREAEAELIGIVERKLAAGFGTAS